MGRGTISILTADSHREPRISFAQDGLLDMRDGLAKLNPWLAASSCSGHLG